VGTTRLLALPGAESMLADHAMAEIDAAIALVACGAARAVLVTGLAGLDAVAADGLARAQAVGVGFTLSRDARTGSAWAVIGTPRP
jgi:hypothetical protein